MTNSKKSILTKALFLILVILGIAVIASIQTISAATDYCYHHRQENTVCVNGYVNELTYWLKCTQCSSSGACIGGQTRYGHIYVPTTEKCGSNLNPTPTPNPKPKPKPNPDPDPEDEDTEAPYVRINQPTEGSTRDIPVRFDASQTSDNKVDFDDLFFRWYANGVSIHQGYGTNGAVFDYTLSDGNYNIRLVVSDGINQGEKTINFDVEEGWSDNDDEEDINDDNDDDDDPNYEDDDYRNSYENDEEYQFLLSQKSKTAGYLKLGTDEVKTINWLKWLFWILLILVLIIAIIIVLIAISRN